MVGKGTPKVCQEYPGFRVGNGHSVGLLIFSPIGLGKESELCSWARNCIRVWFGQGFDWVLGKDLSLFGLLVNFS